jgi:hypothetical protein
MRIIHILDAVVVALAALAVWVGTRRRKAVPLPPGPPKSWVIGNIFQMPSANKYAGSTFDQWKRLYGTPTHTNVLCTCILTFMINLGDVVHLSGLGSSVVILNSLDAANDLLDKRGNNYSDRPIFTVVGEMMRCEKVCSTCFNYHIALAHAVISDGHPDAVWSTMERKPKARTFGTEHRSFQTVRRTTEELHRDALALLDPGPGCVQPANPIVSAFVILQR